MENLNNLSEKMKLFENIKKKAKSILEFIDKADEEFKQGKEIKAFFRVLLAVILVIILASLGMVGLWILFSSFGIFMRVIAGIVVLFLFIPLIFLLIFTYNKFLKKYSKIKS